MLYTGDQCLYGRTIDPGVAAKVLGRNIYANAHEALLCED